MDETAARQLARALVDREQERIELEKQGRDTAVWYVAEFLRSFPDTDEKFLIPGSEAPAAVYLLLDTHFLVLGVTLAKREEEGHYPDAVIEAKVRPFGQSDWRVALRADFADLSRKRSGFKTAWEFSHRDDPSTVEIAGEYAVQPDLWLDGSERFARALAMRAGWNFLEDPTQTA